LSDKFYVGLDLTGFENNGIQRPISRVTLKLDDENILTAGDDSGFELIADCPHATQAIVNGILAEVRGFRYQMYDASDINIDPSMELGDGITASGVYSVISRVADDGSGFPSASAPGEAELEDEYPTGGPMTQEFNRKIAETRSRITKTAEEIRLEILAADGRISQLRVGIDEISTRVQSVEGSFSSITQTVKDITATVQDVEKGLGQTLRISPDGVTITNSKGSKVMIDGGQIKAETLKLTGFISFSDLASDTQGKINSASSNASSALSAANAANSTIQDWSCTYGGKTYIDGEKIYSETIMASKLKGGAVEILTTDGALAGTIKPLYNAGGLLEMETEIFKLSATDISLLNKNSNYVDYAVIDLIGHVSDSWGAFVHLRGNLVPDPHAGNLTKYNLGTPTGQYRPGPWNNIYLQSAPVIVSDLRLKENVAYDLSRYDAFFDALRPICYTLKDSGEKQICTGLGAQDVEAALHRSGLTADDFSGLVAPDGETGSYSLRYEQFIALCIGQIQKLKLRVKQLEEAVV